MKKIIFSFSDEQYDTETTIMNRLRNRLENQLSQYDEIEFLINDDCNFSHLYIAAALEYKNHYPNKTITQTLVNRKNIKNLPESLFDKVNIEKKIRKKPGQETAISNTCCFYGFESNTVFRLVRQNLEETIKYLIEHQHVTSFLVDAGGYPAAYLFSLQEIISEYSNVKLVGVSSTPQVKEKFTKNKKPFDLFIGIESSSATPYSQILTTKKYLIKFSDFLIYYPRETNTMIEPHIRKNKNLKVINLNKKENRQ